MEIRLRSPVAVAVLAVAAAVAGAALYAAVAASHPQQAATRQVLAQVVNPKGAKGRTLALSRVRIPAHTRLALHRHPGHQIAYVQRGRLTYTVRKGSVDVYRGPADAVEPKVVRTVRAGETGSVRAGEWVIERPGDVHFGANRAGEPVVILLATLFTNGRPPSIPVDE
jgi:quercetin dioxygenase-like cupin family protein